MLKKIISIIKKLIFGFFVIYSFNLIMAPLSITIPINVITLIFVGILGFPALLSLIIMFLIMM